MEGRILEAGAEAAAGAARTDAARDHLANLVVLLALLGITENVVRGRDLLEALLGRDVAGIRVGVVLLGELPVRALDVLVRRARLEAEHAVEVLLEPLPLGRHRSASPLSALRAGPLGPRIAAPHDTCVAVAHLTPPRA